MLIFSWSSFPFSSPHYSSLSYLEIPNLPNIIRHHSLPVVPCLRSHLVTRIPLPYKETQRCVTDDNDRDEGFLIKTAMVSGRRRRGHQGRSSGGLRRVRNTFGAALMARRIISPGCVESVAASVWRTVLHCVGGWIMSCCAPIFLFFNISSKGRVL